MTKAVSQTEPNQVGARIVSSREKAGLSQADLARALGAAASSVWRYETGQTMPSSPVAVQIADAVGVNTHWLLTGRDGPRKARPDVEPRYESWKRFKGTRAYATAAEWQQENLRALRARPGEEVPIEVYIDVLEVLRTCEPSPK